jgi:hypothetical protein
MVIPDLFRLSAGEGPGNPSCQIKNETSYEIGLIDKGDFKITQSPLPFQHCHYTQCIVDSFKELNVAQSFP